MNTDIPERIETWSLSDGPAFPVTCYGDAATAKFSTVAIHGLSGNRSDMVPVSRAAAGVGGFVAAVAIPGQADDPEVVRRGDIRDWQIVADHAVACSDQIRKMAMGAPHFLIGESMGAAVAFHAMRRLEDRGNKPAGLIMMVPVPRTKVNPAIRMFARAMSWLAPGLKFRVGQMKHDINALPLTHSEQRQREIDAAENRVRGFSLAFYRELLAMMEAFEAEAPQLTTPVLMQAAGKDLFLTLEASAAFFETIGSRDKTLCTYPDACHLLQFEPGLNHAMSDVTDWLNARLG